MFPFLFIGSGDLDPIRKNDTDYNNQKLEDFWTPQVSQKPNTGEEEEQRCKHNLRCFI